MDKEYRYGPVAVHTQPERSVGQRVFSPVAKFLLPLFRRLLMKNLAERMHIENLTVPYIPEVMWSVGTCRPLSSVNIPNTTSPAVGTTERIVYLEPSVLMLPEIDPISIILSAN